MIPTAQFFSSPSPVGYFVDDYWLSFKSFIFALGTKGYSSRHEIDSV